MRSTRNRATSLTSVVRRKTLFVAVAHALLAPALTQAAIIDVDSTSDTSGAGICILRDAIASANTDTGVGGCDAGSGADTITFDGVVAGDSISLANGALVISTPMTLQGKTTGLPILINAGGLSQVLVIDDKLFESEIDVAASNLVITGGYSPFYNGAGIRSTENLTLDEMVLVGNSANESAGGLYVSRGTVTITDTSIYGNTATFGGAGILARSPDLTITDSEIRDNTLTNGSGAGIAVDKGFMTLRRSTVSGNSTQGGSFRNGGGIDVRGPTFGDQTGVYIVDSKITANSAPAGGGLSIGQASSVHIANSTINSNSATYTGAADRGGAISANSNGQSGDRRFTLTMVNSTLTNNSANRIGAIYANGGVVNLSHITVTGNTAVEGTAPNPYALTGPVGGLQVGDSVSISNSIIANNTGADCNDVLDALISNVNNLFGDGSCDTGAINLVTGDPLIGPLQGNGGPTPTHALLEGSPALDAADMALCAVTDQRGETRNSAECDIGAFEYTEPPVQLVVDTVTDVVADDGYCSLREAVRSANYDATSLVSAGECLAGNGADTITFDQSILPGTIVLGGTELTINSSMEVMGPGSAQLTISGNATSRIFRVGSNSSPGTNQVTLSGVTLTGGTAGGGGAIFSYDHLTIEESVITGNTAFTGGGLSSSVSSLTLRNSTFSNNHAEFNGGAFNTNTSTVTVENSTIDSNTGGGAYSFLGSASISDSSFTNNDLGSGLRAAGASVSIINSVFSGNYYDGSGGGIWLRSSNYGTAVMSIQGSTISGNSAEYYGGGIQTDGEALTVINSTISGNTAGRRGGGVHARENELILVNTTITDNASLGDSGPNVGGGLVQRTNATVRISNSIIANSNAQSDCQFDNPVQVLLHSSNLIEDGSCSQGATNFLTGDPGLGPLQDNGGATESHLPGLGSLVLNNGDDSFYSSSYDQRGPGFARIISGQIDRGAIEAPWLPGELAIDPASIIVDEDSLSASVDIIRTGGTEGTVTVTVNTADDTATASDDYTPILDTIVSFDPGVALQTVLISITDDTDFESDESFTLTLSEPTGGASLGNTTGTITIQSEDIPGVLAIDPASITVDEDAGLAELTVSRTEGVDGDITVRFDTSDDSASSPADYTAVSNGILNIANGSSSGTIQIAIIDDTDFEEDESFTVTLSEPSGGATLGNTMGTVTIQSEDIPGVLAIDPASISVDEDAGTVQVSVTRTGGSDGEVSATVNTLEDSATAGLDFTAIVDQAITFMDGESDPKPVIVTLLSDDEVELEETFSVSISDPTGSATLGNPTSIITIEDEDKPNQENIFVNGFELADE